MASADDKGNVAIIGCGLVGQSWSILFACAGYNVRVYDNEPGKTASGMVTIQSKMADLEEKGCLRGTMTAQEAFTFIHPVDSIRECVDGAIYMQECVFEDFDLKRRVFQEAADYVIDDVIMASSTAAIFPSRLSDGLKHHNRMLIAHPLNPLHLVPLVEVIPAPWTDPGAREGARAILESIGQVPVVARKETQGFIICRIQHSITAECFKLIRDDVIGVDDLDRLMPDGLGLRYAFLGALETSYLNASGMEDFCTKYGNDILELQKQSGPPIALDGDTLRTIQQEIEKRIPLDKLEERRKWRDDRLTELYKLKKNMK